jgi:hypothetical protein
MVIISGTKRSLTVKISSVYYFFQPYSITVPRKECKVFGFFREKKSHKKNPTMSAVKPTKITDNWQNKTKQP